MEVVPKINVLPNIRISLYPTAPVPAYRYAQFDQLKTKNDDKIFGAYSDLNRSFGLDKNFVDGFLHYVGLSAATSETLVHQFCCI